MVQNCGFYTFLTQLPTFLNDVSGWNLGKTGIVAAIPYLIMAIVLQFAGQLADLLRGRFKIRTTLVINWKNFITISFSISK
jgi:ACS family sodium-dependent inorganic phosphate cotransporter